MIKFRQDMVSEIEQRIAALVTGAATVITVDIFPQGDKPPVVRGSVIVSHPDGRLWSCHGAETVDDAFDEVIRQITVSVKRET